MVGGWGAAVVACRRGPLPLERCFCSAVGVACRGAAMTLVNTWRPSGSPRHKAEGCSHGRKPRRSRPSPNRTVAKAEVIYKACAVVEVVATGGGP